jgi:L-ascorbate metabolism protein UlaG (beta-lactamase superfamily)
MRIAALVGAVFALLVAQGCARPLARVDADVFPDPAPNAITFWGHACCYIDLDGFGIVTDPVFVDATLFRVRKAPAPPPPAYRGARVVLISHAHADHLNPKSLATFPRETVILCPEPSAGHLGEIGREVRVMEPGDEYAIPGGKITAVVAKHPGGRWGVTASTDGGALGYVIETPTATMFYSGDTIFFEGFERVGQTYRPDIVLLNINGHLHSEDAVRAARATRASTIVPMHFGAYGYFQGAERRTPRDYDEMRRELGSQLVILDLAASLPLPPS